MIIAGTGHRPGKITVGGKNAYDDRIYGGLVEFATACLEEAAPEAVISGMALGWDQALAEACATSGLPFIAAVPHDQQDKPWPAKSRRRYHWLLGQAREVRVVSPGPYAPWKMQARNVWMVNNADEMLALWNGTHGGTLNCVEYANEQGKPVRNVWEKWLAFTKVPA